MLAGGAHELRPAGDGTIGADLNMTSKAREMVQDVVFHKIPGVLLIIVVIRMYAHFDIRVIHHVFQIDHFAVLIHRIYSLIIIWPHVTTPLST